MKLETAGRGDFDNPDEERIKTEIAELDNNNNNHAILSSGDGFLQTAKTGQGYLLEYRDGTGYYSSSNESIPLSEVQKAFLLYLKNDDSWKNNFKWNKNEDHAEGDSAEGSSNPVDDLLNNVKKRALNAAKKKLGRFFKF